MPMTHDDVIRFLRGQEYLRARDVDRLVTAWPEPTEWQEQQIAYAKQQHELAKTALQAMADVQPVA